MYDVKGTCLADLCCVYFTGVSDLASLSGDAELSDDLDMSDVNLSSSAACDGENFMFSSTFHSELQAVPSSDNENSQVIFSLLIFYSCYFIMYGKRVS